MQIGRIDEQMVKTKLKKPTETADLHKIELVGHRLIAGKPEQE